MPAATASPAAPVRRRLAPRFSLAAALIAITLCAIGLWYWFRVPFEVEHDAKIVTEVESLRRTWNGTVRHGPRRVYHLGDLKLLENYADGAPHGLWQWYGADGQTFLTARFSRGRIESIEAQECDARLARHLAEGTIKDQRMVMLLLTGITLDIHSMPLKDAVALVSDMLGTKILLDMRRIEDAEVAPDAPVTCSVTNQPLIMALPHLLKGYPLATDYRYGSLWITSADSAKNWRDPTGIESLELQPGSPLARELRLISALEATETPFRFVVQILQDQHKVQMDWTRLSQKEADAPVTLNIRGHSLRDTLGILLEALDLRCEADGETIVIDSQARPSGKQKDGT